MRMLRAFLEGVGSSYLPDEEGVVKVNNKRFTLDEGLLGLIVRRDNLVYAGRFMGKNRREFHPSAILLRELTSEEGPPNRVHVDREVGWLFVCGRDIFEESALRVEGGFKEGTLSLVMMDGHYLGYGRVQSSEGRRILKNLFDIGDFLRRERWRDGTP